MVIACSHFGGYGLPVAVSLYYKLLLNRCLLMERVYQMYVRVLDISIPRQVNVRKDTLSVTSHCRWAESAHCSIQALQALLLLTDEA